MSGPIGTGNLVFNAGDIGVFASGGPRVVRNLVTVNQNFSIEGSEDLELGGNIALGSATRTVTVNNAGATLFSGVISGTNGLTKAGPGVLTLSGVNTYSGLTTVSAGALEVLNTGSIAGSIKVNSGATFDVSDFGSGFAIAAGRTLSGSGTVAGAIIVQGTLAPGESAGTLASGDLTIGSTGTYIAEIDWNFDLSAQPSADQVDVTGTVDLASGSTLEFQFIDVLAGDTVVSPPRTVVLIRNDGADPVGDGLGGSGVFTNIVPASGAFAGLVAYTIDYTYDADTNTPGAGNDVAVTFSSVPEPGGGLMLLALGAWASRRRRAGVSKATGKN
jgi:autotransporter-associated beta strand protein